MIKKLINKLKVHFYSNEKYINILRSYCISIGKNCEIYKNVDFGSEPYLVRIGNHVRITNGVKFITHDGGVWVLREKEEYKNIDLFSRINVGNNVHIGINAIIMPGVNIGDNVIIGCGAVVTKNIPSNQIWGGVPAHQLSDITQYLEKHISDFEYTKQMSHMEKKKYLINKYKD
ncbi:MAG: acyltransferase [Beduini sp.]|uniref:acyltransferase n=1 Tax=Beduini sp. TaxID=1922300 RepID=UPI0039A37F33